VSKGSEQMIRAFRWSMALAVSFILLGGCEKPEPTPEAMGSGGSSASGGTAPVGIGGGGGEPEVPVEKKGERGSSCDSSRDCADDLSCISGGNCPVGLSCADKSCQPSNFDIMGTGKQCVRVECETRADCCGDMPLEAPEKCQGRDAKCSWSVLPGCVTTSCEESSECGAGACEGRCIYDSETCLTTNDCVQDVCDFGGTGGAPGTGGASTGGASGGSGGTSTGGGSTTGGSGTGGGTTFGRCTLSGLSCTSDTNCYKNTCSTPVCNCVNEDYDPTDPICTDEDCEGICGFTCGDERCVVDTSCKVDLDCLSPTPLCDAGTCVECVADEDCEDEKCVSGHCGPECEDDTQCALFEVCKANECAYVGCQTDRECVLAAAEVAEEPRLLVCEVDAGVGTCVYPCEVDAQCAATEVCLSGRCEYIGCETDAECKTISGLHNLPVPTEERPWTTRAECRADQP
jgi:hypothetical protein